MRMDLVQLFRDFRKLTHGSEDLRDIEELLNEEFQIDRSEVKDLHDVFYSFLADKFELDKVTKKQAEQLDLTVEVMYDAFFFGMFVAKGFCWAFPASSSDNGKIPEH